MAHKHPVTSGQMWGGGLGDCVFVCVFIRVLGCELFGQREAVTRGEAAPQRNSKEDISPGDDAVGCF